MLLGYWQTETSGKPVMCAHNDFIEAMDGTRECLNCGLVYHPEDEEEDDTQNSENPHAEDIPW